MSTIEPISPVWPPASYPWAIMTSTPAAWWRSACTARPARAPTSFPEALTASIIDWGGGPRALATKAARWARAMSSWGPAALAENGASPPVMPTPTGTAAPPAPAPSPSEGRGGTS